MEMSRDEFGGKFKVVHRIRMKDEGSLSRGTVKVLVKFEHEIRIRLVRADSLCRMGEFGGGGSH